MLLPPVAVGSKSVCPIVIHSFVAAIRHIAYGERHLMALLDLTSEGLGWCTFVSAHMPFHGGLGMTTRQASQ